MERITLKKLLENSDVQIVGSQEIEITGLASNSKLVVPGNLFIAKKGFKADGAKFIPDAIAAGATALLTDLYNPSYPHITQIIHPDVAAIENAIANAFYGYPCDSLFLVGITGTNGKTTTAYLIRHLFEKKGSSCGLIGTVEWNVGKHTYPSTHTTPDLLQNMKLFQEMVANRCQACVMEVSSHALDQGRVQSIEFDVAVFTNLTQDHLDYHPTMEDYSAAKAKLFSSLKSSKTAVINVDSPASEQMIATCNASCITYGIELPCDLKASFIALTPSGMQFDLSFQGQHIKVTSPLIGRYNIYNILAAAGVGLAYGMQLSDIASIFKELPQVPGRLDRVSNDKGLNIFVDYAHTDDALINVLKTLQEFKKGRLITVFGCGGDRDPLKRPKMGAAVEMFSDLAIVTSDNPRSEDPEEIIRAILAGLKKPSEALVTVDREKAIHQAISIATQDDIILIAGKGHECEQVLANEKIHFDDKTVALAATRSLL